MATVRVMEKVEGGRERLFTMFGRSSKIVQQDVENIRNWFAKQPHLPEIPDDAIIERFLIMSKFYVETVKSKLDMYYTVRSLIPEFYNQHPCSEAAREIENVMYSVLIPHLDSSFSRIICWKLKDTNPDKFNIVSMFCYWLNIVEIRIREDVSETDTYICDLEGFTFTHMTKFTPMLLKKINFLLEKVFFVRSKCIYILNAPSFVDAFITLLGKYVKPKLMKRIVICKDFDELYQAIPKSELPKDFNGSLKSLQEYQDAWVEKFEQSKLLFDYLMSLRVNESLRSGKPLQNDILGIQGNFRQLTID